MARSCKEHIETIGGEYEEDRGGGRIDIPRFFHDLDKLIRPTIESSIVTIHWRFTLTWSKYITADDTEKNSQTALHKGRRRLPSITSRLLKPPLRFIIEAATRGWRTLCKFIRPYDFQMGGDRRFYAAKMDTSPSPSLSSLLGNILSKPVRKGASLVNFFLSNVLLFISARFISLPFFIDRW